MPDQYSTSQEPDDSKSGQSTGPFMAPIIIIKRWSWRKRILVALSTFVVLAGLSIGGAEYYTAQPYFCRSCHVMESYWQSWNRDIHGSKFDIACVDCHYAPGERLTIHAKFKGLSQATSYFSGRWGSSRPRAHVNDASCLVSACHGDGKFVDQKLPIGETRTEERIVAGTPTKVQRTPTVIFTHSKHLNVGGRVEETAKKIETLTAALKTKLPPDIWASLELFCNSVAPLPERELKINLLLNGRQLDEHANAAVELAQMIDLDLRLTQLAGLNCAACHTYDPSGDMHFTVDRQTCYTCHFTNQSFNSQTGRCLNCHVPPSRQIMVHAPATTEGAKPSIMNHQDILDRNIDCASCHLDLVQGEGHVTARECAHCHDRAVYLEKFETRTIEDVKEYHRVHVAAQNARCPDCHGSVKHELVEPTLVATSAGFLKPVLDDCQHCHPRHHQEQVELLMGTGGKNIDQPMPNAMFGSRLNCRGCHKESAQDFKGAPLIGATADTCIACHDPKYGDMLKDWINEISAYLNESEKALARVNKRLEENKAAGKPISPRVLELIKNAEHNIHLVKIGNGIHNRNFATHLLDVSDDNLRQALSLLASAGTATGADTAPVHE